MQNSSVLDTIVAFWMLRTSHNPAPKYTTVLSTKVFTAILMS
jgi:hypothetical protein